MTTSAGNPMTTHALQPSTPELLEAVCDPGVDDETGDLERQNEMDTTRTAFERNIETHRNEIFED